MNDPVTSEALYVVSVLLRQGERLDRLSRALTVVALIAIVLTGVMLTTLRDDARVQTSLAWYTVLLPGGALLAGLAQVWLAMRTGIDAALFERVATGATHWDIMDTAMLRLRLMPAAKIRRPVEARVAGALRLLRLQGVALAVQCLLLIIPAFRMLVLIGAGQ